MPYTKFNSKWINLNVSAKTIKLVEESININLYDLEQVNSFLAMILKAQSTIEKK